MPHLVVLYTPNLDKPAAEGGVDMTGLCRALADTMLAVRDLSVFYGDAQIEINRTITDNFENRLHNIDFVYGRTFGKRRFTGHWWGGLRYSVYEGNLPAAAVTCVKNSCAVIRCV